MIREEWLKPLYECAEKLFIIDESTKQIIWLNGEDVLPGRHCWEVLMGRKAPCPFCPALHEGEFYSWDCYDSSTNCWLKVKYRLLKDEGRLLRAGNLTVIDDMMQLNRESIDEVSSLQALLRENKRIKAELEREASCDLMTGLCNRNRFNLDIASGIYDKPDTGVLYFDINNLKAVNDHYRHDRGDTLICHTAAGIAAAVADRPDACGYRIGGDEFIIIVLHTSPEELESMRERFFRYMQENPTDPPCITASGTAFSAESCDVELLVMQADSAMYADKQRLKKLYPEQSRT